MFEVVEFYRKTMAITHKEKFNTLPEADAYLAERQHPYSSFIYRIFKDGKLIEDCNECDGFGSTLEENAGFCSNCGGTGYIVIEESEVN
jgi:hypothetical protein